MFVCVWTSYYTCNSEMDNARHANLHKGTAATPSVKQKRNDNQ